MAIHNLVRMTKDVFEVFLRQRKTVELLYVFPPDANTIILAGRPQGHHHKRVIDKQERDTAPSKQMGNVEPRAQLTVVILARKVIRFLFKARPSQSVAGQGCLLKDLTIWQPETKSWCCWARWSRYLNISIQWENALSKTGAS